MCKDAIEKAGYTGKIKIGMDVAASEFFKDGKYDLDFKNPDSNADEWLSAEKLGDLYKSFIDEARPFGCTVAKSRRVSSMKLAKKLDETR